MQKGDFVKGTPESNKHYGITNEKMTRGLVVDINECDIRIKVMEHEGNTNIGSYFDVDPAYFEVIGHVKPFNREEVLDLLRKGCKKGILEFDLREANLQEADLQEANLRGADLQEADLQEANLRGADLQEANLQEANLRGADLQEANLQEANLQEANLQEADLRGANLRGANLRGADLQEADLQEANLRGADLRGANLQEADLRGANLRGANLRGADLQEADLRGADLRGANLDFSCLPLRCGGLRWKIDKRLACQIAYHLCSMQCDDAEYVKMRNSILTFANQFHRVDECGYLGEIPMPETKATETAEAAEETPTNPETGFNGQE